MKGNEMTDVALIVEGSYPYVTGGVSAWTQQLIEGLPDVSFSVAHLGGSGTSRYGRPRNLVELLDLPVDHETGEAMGDLPGARVYHALATGSAGSAAARVAAERGRRFIVSEHGLALVEARLGISACKPGYVASARLVDTQARAAYRDAFAITSVSRSNARFQLANGAERVRVVPNPAPASRAADERDPASPLVGFVGRVVPVKDVGTFLRACRIISDAMPSARFVVVGPLHQDEDYALQCRALAETLELAVEFTGETDAGPWYPRLDALVLTSRSEAQPLVALEAMSAGVPVIASSVGGCPELLAGCGLLTPIADPNATAAAVLRVLRSPFLCARLAAAGRDRARRHHAPAAMLAAFAELYEAAAA
jgi:glycosyltransferase involved in cell wall biosynthesis